MELNILNEKSCFDYLSSFYETDEYLIFTVFIKPDFKLFFLIRDKPNGAALLENLFNFQPSFMETEIAGIYLKNKMLNEYFQVPLDDIDLNNFWNE